MKLHQESRISGVCASLLAATVLVACAGTPPDRMDAYIGPPSQGSVKQASLPAPVDVGLVLINDTTAPGSAPAISEHGLAFLTDQVRKRMEEGTPVRIAKIVPANSVQPAQSVSPFLEVARSAETDYVLLAIFSSAESEVPKALPLNGDVQQGGGPPFVQGFEDVNYALAELALLDGKTGQVLVRTHGRAWMTLHRLYVPVKSNAYPVIHRAREIAPIYPKEENARDILRSLAADEALEQAILNLQRAKGWAVSANRPGGLTGAGPLA